MVFTLFLWYFINYFMKHLLKYAFIPVVHRIRERKYGLIFELEGS